MRRTLVRAHALLKEAVVNYPYRQRKQDIHVLLAVGAAFADPQIAQNRLVSEFFAALLSGLGIENHVNFGLVSVSWALAKRDLLLLIKFL